MSQPAKVLEFPENSENNSGSGGPKKFFDPSRLNEVFKKNMVIVGACCAVAVTVLVLSYKWFIFARTHIETNNSYIEGEVFHVQARIMGFTKTMQIQEGQEVHKGDVLTVLDDTDILVEKGFKEAKLKKASADFNRAVKLVKLKMVSESDYEALEAALAAAQADANGTDLKLKYTQILAPADGVIAKIYVRSGQFIQPGQNLFSLVSKKNLWIKANYKETQIEKIKKGQAVMVEVDAYPGHPIYGRVEEIYPSSGAVVSLFPPENATGNFTKVVQRVPVKISLPEKNPVDLRPGMSVITTVLVDEHIKEGESSP
jgi:RND family efflux transporter MFP subunit